MLIRRILIPVGLSLLLAGCGAAGVADLLGLPFSEAPVPDGGSGTPEAMSQGERAWAMDVFVRTNGEREARGLPPLIWDELASETAYGHAYDMDARKFVGHENPDGELAGHRLTRHGVEWRMNGENLGMGQESAGEVVSRWMDSPGHAANILHPDLTHLGVGVHTRDSAGPWWVQNFYR